MTANGECKVVEDVLSRERGRVMSQQGGTGLYLISIAVKGLGVAGCFGNGEECVASLLSGAKSGDTRVPTSMPSTLL